VIFGAGGFFKCFSSHRPVIGFRCRKMKCTLLVVPHLSGPNMIVKGVFSELEALFPAGHQTYLVGVVRAISETALALGEELDVGSTALKTLLQLDLVLND